MLAEQGLLSLTIAAEHAEAIQDYPLNWPDTIRSINGSSLLQAEGPAYGY